MKDRRFCNLERPRDVMDRVVSSLQTPPDWDEDERPGRDPFRRLAEMSKGVSPGYAGIVFGKNRLTLFSHIAAFLAMPARMAVGIVCIERPPDAVMSEIIACVSGIPADYMRQRRVPPPLFPTLNIALSRIYHARLFFIRPDHPDVSGVHLMSAWLKRRHKVKVLMVDSIEAVANACGDRKALLGRIVQLQAIAENLGLCLVATSRSAGIDGSLEKGATFDSDGYEW